MSRLGSLTLVWQPIQKKENSEFKTCKTQLKKLTLCNILLMQRCWVGFGFMAHQLWTFVTMSISYNGNHYITSASMNTYIFQPSLLAEPFLQILSKLRPLLHYIHNLPLPREYHFLSQHLILHILHYSIVTIFMLSESHTLISYKIIVAVQYCITKHSLLDSHTQTHQCWPTSKNLHPLAQCRHWIPSRWPTRSTDQ